MSVVDKIGDRLIEAVTVQRRAFQGRVEALAKFEEALAQYKALLKEQQDLYDYLDALLGHQKETLEIDEDKMYELLNISTVGGQLGIFLKYDPATVAFVLRQVEPDVFKAAVGKLPPERRVELFEED